MDETPFFLNMQKNKTIVIKGSKQVIIKTQGQEKCRFSCMLCILADGDKLPPLVIFKAKDKGRVYKNLLDDPNVKLWTSKEIVDRWFKKIW